MTCYLKPVAGQRDNVIIITLSEWNSVAGGWARDAQNRGSVISVTFPPGVSRYSARRNSASTVMRTRLQQTPLTGMARDGSISKGAKRSRMEPFATAYNPRSKTNNYR
jgi:hypothetical protein